MAVTLTANLTHITDPAVQAIFFDGFTAFQEDFSWLNLAPSNKAQIIHQGMNPAPGYAPHTGGAEIVTRTLCAAGDDTSMDAACRYVSRSRSRVFASAWP